MSQNLVSKITEAVRKIYCTDRLSVLEWYFSYCTDSLSVPVGNSYFHQ